MRKKERKKERIEGEKKIGKIEVEEKDFNGYKEKKKNVLESGYSDKKKINKRRKNYPEKKRKFIPKNDSLFSTCCLNSKGIFYRSIKFFENKY